MSLGSQSNPVRISSTLLSLFGHFCFWKTKMVMTKSPDSPLTTMGWRSLYFFTWYKLAREQCFLCMNTAQVNESTQHLTSSTHLSLLLLETISCDGGRDERGWLGGATVEIAGVTHTFIYMCVCVCVWVCVCLYLYARSELTVILCQLLKRPSAPCLPNTQPVTINYLPTQPRGPERPTW